MKTTATRASQRIAKQSKTASIPHTQPTVTEAVDGHVSDVADSDSEKLNKEELTHQAQYDTHSDSDDDVPEAISTRLTKETAMASQKAQQESDKISKELIKTRRRNRDETNKAQQQLKRDRMATAASLAKPISLETLQAASDEKAAATKNADAALAKGKHTRLDVRSNRATKRSIRAMKASGGGGLRMGGLKVVSLENRNSNRTAVALSVQKFRLAKLFKSSTKRVSAVDTLAKRSWTDMQSAPTPAPFFTK
ncbi:hypothetical protein BASA60_003343 [Batrachochytrium salamandrivorans]|nr:hypothetical protein BASA60_003343 [Batrachochytrium salamandrivorans]KAH9252581.1 hypothetical protein BASA81_009450 [Batrachochytrium salamandrivorans]